MINFTFLILSAVFAFKEAVSLDGDWEMAYSPYFLEVDAYPAFSGKVVKNAVPGYWEDMVERFRAAGIKDEFRINPDYTPRTLPARGWAPDTKLPQLYGCFFYRRHITLGEPRDAYLAFEGVRNDVRVWVNGQFVEYREGYSTPFTIEIPASFFRKGDNEITLAVQNKLNIGYNGGEVRGLTSRAIFRATGGINGHVELQFPKNNLRDVYVTTAKDLKTFTIHVNGDVKYSYSILEGGSRRSVVSGSAKGDITLSTDGLAFWSPDKPVLHTLTLTTSQGVFTHRFGLRRLTTDGVKLRLNGEPIYLSGITEHCYFPTTVHLPRDLNYYRMITKKRKELCFNFVRFHTFIPPVEYLQACDELGMLVHVESPNFVPEWEFKSIIDFARVHPCVVIYCTGNETRIDRIAETYLESIARLVHERTDSLFSPMSALRGLEYALYPKIEPVVNQPFRHNQERFDRLNRYCDLYTSYQLSATSYDYLDGLSMKTIDSFAPCYGNKPRLAHETCIDGSYADLSLEALYPPNSPILKTGLISNIRKVLTEKGLIDRAPRYFTNSCAWTAMVRKYGFEKVRSSSTTAGFDFLGDINTHWHTYGYSVGLMDEFYRLKPYETVERVRMYNSPVVVLADFDTNFIFPAGATHRVNYTLSNRGELSSLGSELLTFPDSTEARVYPVEKCVTVDGAVVSNRWQVYVFPKPITVDAKGLRVVTDISRNDLLAAMEKGEKVLLLGTGPFKTSPMTFNAGRAGRCSGNFATVIRNHPALEGFPHEGYCGWQFRRMMHKARVAQLETAIPFNPIIDVASAVKCPIRQAALFEYRVGNGRLMVCTFAFNADDPAAEFLKSRLVAYAASDRFEPTDVISLSDLAGVIDAPLTRSTANPNRASNPADAASRHRAGVYAQP